MRRFDKFILSMFIVGFMLCFSTVVPVVSADGATPVGDRRIDYYEYGVGYERLFGYTIEDQTYFWVNMTYVNNTYFNYTWENSSYSHMEDGLISGYSFNGVSYIRCVTDETNPAHVYYWDDIVVENYESGQFDGCESTYFKVEKRFDGSVAYTNSTVHFYYSVKQLLIGDWDIINNAGDTVLSGSVNGLFGNVYFMPEYGDGYGTFYFRMKKYDQSGWDMWCPFTVTNASGVGDWYVSFDKAQYMDNEWVYLDYIIPSGQFGDIVVKNRDLGVSWNLDNVYGSGGELSMALNIDFVEGHCYIAYLYNASNDNLMDVSDYMCIDSGLWYYSIKVNGENSCDVNYNDTVVISGYIDNMNPYDIYIWIFDENVIADYNIMNNVVLDKIGINSDTFSREWLADLNDSVGVENAYVYLGNEDDIFRDHYCVVSIYDEDDEDMDGTVEPYEERPESEWNFAMGIFCVFGGVIGTVLFVNRAGITQALTQSFCGAIGGVVGLGFAMYYELVDIYIGVLIGLVLGIIMFFILRSVGR